jgi:hypothetical protein
VNGKLTRRVEFIANVAVIVLAVLLGVILIKNYFLSGSPWHVTQPAPSNSKTSLPPGSKITIPNVNWGESERTLLLAVSVTCHFCTESAGFYQQLALARSQHPGIHIVAVLPQEISQGQEYLKHLEVNVDDVRQSSLDAIGVSGTPTLILVGHNGEVIQSWVGKLPPDKEVEVLSKLTGERQGG